MNILVFAPHPDDDVIGCGGSIAKHIAQKNIVSIVYLTSGAMGSGSKNGLELTTIREKEAREGAKILGVTDTIFLRIPDGSVSVSDENIKKITQSLIDKKPDIVYLPHKNDNHIDHKASHTLIMEAINYAVNAPTILAYEVWTPIQDVTYIEDITSTIDTKIKALRKHVTQIENTRFDEAMYGFNRFRGIMKETGDYAECFQVVRLTKLSFN